MGPHFFKCGKLQRLASMGPHFFASMGPHFFKCGKCRLGGTDVRRDVRASMGPHFFKCGKRFLTTSTNANGVVRFNGAALFQVRKGHYRDVGNGIAGARLQWGRTFSSAESPQRIVEP